MDDFTSPEGAHATEYRRIERNRAARANRAAARPDRFAFWAFGLAVVMMLVAVASARGEGGISTGENSSRTGCVDTRFGSRTLQQGDCGDDVKTLNWILRSKQFGDRVDLEPDFDGTTTETVKDFERQKDQNVNGKVEDATRRALLRSMDRQRATWYGPGFFGNTTACGQTLRRRTIGVAHKRLPCGTKVVLGYKGRTVRAKVIDRGPYANHARWDLTQKTARSLNFEGTDDVRVAKVRRG